MLTLSVRTVRAPRGGAAKQRGTVLMFALILIVVLLLAGIALTRSVSTSNIIAGNLAFQQSAVHAADRGVETAIGWIEGNAAALTADSAANGYYARRVDPAAGQSWEAFWTASLGAGAVTLAQDAAGNTVSYVIHRLCNNVGAPAYPGCSASPVDTGSAGNSYGAGVVALSSVRQIYYRVTVRVVGPRNTTSLVQTVVAM